jgi:hypothetical protein
MACQCNCCGGACCYDFAGTPTCTFETCADCEDLNGEWQGPGTECTGDDLNDCPCDPPADHTECKKCVDGTPTARCAEGENCCDGVCQEEECSECEGDEDCPLGQCCDGGECGDGYCHYRVDQNWIGEGAGTCPGGWVQVGVTELGKVSCKLCETVQEAECDEQAWYTGKNPGEGWTNPDPGFRGDCDPVSCDGVCDPDYGCACDGCTCVEIEEDYYECVAEEPPP